MEDKKFGEWIELKEKLHYVGRVPAISEGEIWWCGFGENVGVEINGKNSVFSRPVLIMRKLSRLGFMGVPLTSQEHSGSWYTEFEFLNRKEYAALCQARVMSVSRLYDKIGQIPKSDLELVRARFKDLYC